MEILKNSPMVELERRSTKKNKTPKITRRSAGVSGLALPSFDDMEDLPPPTADASCVENITSEGRPKKTIHDDCVARDCLKVDSEFNVLHAGGHGQFSKVNFLTLTVLVATIDAQWEGMRDVGSARYEPALLTPCPTIRVLSYSN